MAAVDLLWESAFTYFISFLSYLHEFFHLICFTIFILQFEFNTRLLNFLPFFFYDIWIWNNHVLYRSFLNWFLEVLICSISIIVWFQISSVFLLFFFFDQWAI